MALHSMAKEYGRAPIDLMFPQGGYSVMEAQLFNLFVLQVGLEEEARQIKAARK